MPGNAYEMFRSAAFHLQFDPDNTGYKKTFYRVLNEQAEDFYNRCRWSWNAAVGYVYARGDYSTGTATLTQNSRVVTGSGTSWNETHEGMWIGAGTSPSEVDYVRIGRVASATQILLVDPYAPTTASSSAYVIRQRYIPLPRDVLAYDGMVARATNYGPLRFFTEGEAEDMFLRPGDGGNPVAFTPAVPPPWRLGATQPDSPATAPTLTAAAGGSLTSGATYRYKYTWVMNGIETGASPEAEVTVTAPNLTTTLSNLELIGAVQGRYARIYRADSTGIFYRVGDVTTLGATTTPTTDDGTLTDYTRPFYEGGQIKYIRVWPRTSETKLELELRYQARPRLIQKDSDYLDMPIDAQNAVLFGTISAMARAYNKGAVAAQLQKAADAAMDQAQRTGLVARPAQMVVQRNGGMWDRQIGYGPLFRRV